MFEVVSIMQGKDVLCSCESNLYDTLVLLKKEVLNTYLERARCLKQQDRNLWTESNNTRLPQR